MLSCEHWITFMVSSVVDRDVVDTPGADCLDEHAGQLFWHIGNKLDADDRGVFDHTPVLLVPLPLLSLQPHPLCLISDALPLGLNRRLLVALGLLSGFPCALLCELQLPRGLFLCSDALLFSPFSCALALLFGVEQCLRSSLLGVEHHAVHQP